MYFLTNSVSNLLYYLNYIGNFILINASELNSNILFSDYLLFKIVSKKNYQKYFLFFKFNVSIMPYYIKGIL